VILTLLLPNAIAAILRAEVRSTSPACAFLTGQALCASGEELTSHLPSTPPTLTFGAAKGERRQADTELAARFFGLDKRLCTWLRMTARSPAVGAADTDVRAAEGQQRGQRRQHCGIRQVAVVVQHVDVHPQPPHLM